MAEIFMQKIDMANVPQPNFVNERQSSGTIYKPYGDDNLFPQRLLEYYNKSVTHKSCINLVSKSIAGKGWTVTSDGAREFLSKLDYQTSKTTMLKKIATSQAINNGFALHVIYNKGGKIEKVYYVPFEMVRASEELDENGEPLFYLYNPNWEQRPNESKEIKPFGYKPKDLDGKEIKYTATEEILYMAEFNPASLYYPTPSYDTVLNYIALEYELGKFHLSTAMNGFLPSHLITIIGSATEEKKREHQKLFNRTYTGTENAGKVMITYVDSPDEKPIVETISATNVVDVYNQNSIESSNKIITAHGVTSPALIAINDGNSSIFSSGEELKTAWDVFQANTIDSYQQSVEYGINLILEGAGFPNENFKIVPFSLLTITGGTVQETSNKVSTETTVE